MVFWAAGTEKPQKTGVYFMYFPEPPSKNRHQNDPGKRKKPPRREDPYFRIGWLGGEKEARTTLKDPRSKGRDGRYTNGTDFARGSVPY